MKTAFVSSLTEAKEPSQSVDFSFRYSETARLPRSSVLNPGLAEPAGWLRRKLQRVLHVRHAIELWLGHTPLEKPGRIELAITPIVRSWATVLPLIVSDLLGLVASTLLSFLILRAFGPLPVRGIHRVMPVLSTALVLAYLCSGLYAVIGINAVVELRQLTRLNTLLVILALAGTYVAHANHVWRAFLILQWGLSGVMLPLARSRVRPLCAKTAWWGQPALIFGPPQESIEMVRTMRHHPSCGVRPVALVACMDSLGCDAYDPDQCDLPVLSLETARRLVLQSRICYAIIVNTQDPVSRESQIAQALAIRLSHVLVLSPREELPSLWRDTRECAGMPAVEVQNRLILPWPRIIKRTTDLVLTLSGGLLIAPLLLAIAAGVKLTSPGPIFFCQTRIGKKGLPFKVWKFRTMVADAPAVLEKHLNAHPELREEWERDHKLKNDPRITAMGRLLRRTSMDELPQLWNVLRGDMSLVGPRPIVDEEVQKYGSIYEHYKQAKPGITGLWQVSGRNETTYPERIKLDEYYVRNWSNWLDVYVLACTVSAVLGRSGAY